MDLVYKPVKKFTDKVFRLPVNTEITQDIILQAIEFNDKLAIDYTKLENYYLGDHEVLRRKKTIALKNRKVVTNHSKYITDINVGYLLGNPVDYVTEDTDIEVILDSFKRQTINDLDVEIAKDCSRYGRAYEYEYINTDGETKTINLDPRNCVVIYDDTIEMKPIVGILYEKVDKTITRIDVVSKTEIKRYVNKNGVLTVQDTTLHLFREVPVVEYWNNKELQGDFEQVIPLIDAYNFLQSDRVNDKEQLVESILALYGFGLTEDQKENLLIYRTLADIPVEGRAEYITKTFDETQIEVLRSALEQDIHKISMTPNMSDENFVGNSSGVAIAYKLLPFEQNTKNKERFMEQGLKKRVMLYNNYFVATSKMSELDIADLDVVFKRNLPANLLEIAQIINYLKGTVSQETLVGLLPFVKDASLEVQHAQEEGLRGINMELPEYGTPEATLETLEEKGLIEASAKQESLLSKLKNILNG
jgi:SPP1 family phage portal protein